MVSNPTEQDPQACEPWHLDLLKEAEGLANFGIWRLDLDTNDLKWSPQVYHIHGVTPEDYAPTVETAIAFYHPEDREKVASYVAQAIESGKEFDFELRLITQSGEERIVYSHAKLRDSEGGERILFGTFQDVTDSYLMREKRQREAKIQKLTYSNADLERFAYACSHDLQQPMRITHSFAVMLKERYEEQLDDKGREYLGFIINSMEQSRALVRDVLELSRLESEAVLVEQVDLTQLMAGLCDSLQATIDSIDAQVHVHSLPTLRGSRALYYQLFSNLIGNALKFHRDGVAPVVDIGAEASGDWWEFWVTDNGIGIEEAYCDEVFVQFKRLHSYSDYPGTGLGLAICRKVVEKYGGEITCKPAPEHGTHISFRLPRSLTVSRAA